MAFRDPLLAARDRLQALEQELEQVRQEAARSARLQRENRALRAALARARTDYMPTAARYLGIGAAGAAVLATYLLVKLGLSLVGGSLHYPSITTLAFGAMLIGLFSLCQLNFGTTAPAGLLLALFLFNQASVLASGVEMAAIANVSWLSTIALGTYIVARAQTLPRWLSRGTAIMLLATGLMQLAVALSWHHLQRLADQGRCGIDGLMELLSYVLVALYLAATVALAACFFAARQRLLETAPHPPEEPR